MEAVWPWVENLMQSSTEHIGGCLESSVSLMVPATALATGETTSLLVMDVRAQLDMEFYTYIPVHAGQ